MWMQDRDVAARAASPRRRRARDRRPCRRVAVGLPDEHAEVLEDLASAHRAGLDVGLELRGGLLAPKPGPTGPRKLTFGEQDHPVLVLAGARCASSALPAAGRRTCRSALTRICRLIGVHRLHRRVSYSAGRDRRRLDGCGCRSTGNFARGTGCCGDDERATSACTRGWSAAGTRARALRPAAAGSARAAVAARRADARATASSARAAAHEAKS